MRDRLAAKLGLTSVLFDAASDGMTNTTWGCKRGWQSGQVLKETQGVDWKMYEPAMSKSARGKGSRARRPWNSSLRESSATRGEAVGASMLGMSGIADVDSLSIEYMKQSRGRQQSLMAMLARHAAVMELS
jgi:hypothetical protein